MSFDLAVWYSPRALDPAAADAVYQALAEGVNPPRGAPIAGDPRVAAFRAALASRYPDLDAVPEAELDGSPWACGPEGSDRYVIMNLRWSAEDAVLHVIAGLAAEHGLVLYDPQGPEVHLPPGLSPAQPRWQFWRR